MEENKTDNCCYSGLQMNTDDLNLLKEANMNTYNRDLRNVGLCLKSLEVTMGKEISEQLRSQAIEYIRTGIMPPL